MPRRTGHTVAGLAVGLMAWSIVRSVRGDSLSPDPSIEGLVEFGAYVSLAWVGSRFPDKAEPPENPQHRGFIHSFPSLILFVVLFSVIWINLGCPGIARINLANPVTIFPHLVLPFIGGYFSHLVLDGLL